MKKKKGSGLIFAVILLFVILAHGRDAFERDRA